MVGDLTREQVEEEVDALVADLRKVLDPFSAATEDVLTLAYGRAMSETESLDAEAVVAGHRAIAAAENAATATAAFELRQRKLVKQLGRSRAAAVLSIALVRVGVPMFFSMVLAVDYADSL